MDKFEINQRTADLMKIPEIGIIADSNYRLLGKDPELTLTEVIASIFAYLLLNEEIGIGWDVDQITLNRLKEFGADVKLMNGIPTLIFKS